MSRNQFSSCVQICWDNTVIHLVNYCLKGYSWQFFLHYLTNFSQEIVFQHVVFHYSIEFFFTVSHSDRCECELPLFAFYVCVKYLLNYLHSSKSQ